MNLKHLADKHGTDKSHHGHNYMPFYEEHLPRPVKSLLEIGIKEGRSMNMWREAYPDAYLIGLDLFQEFKKPDTPEVFYIKGNQIDHEVLYNIRHTIRPQVIIDDGSHNSGDQWVTMISLIGCCEYYFVEDLHCCRAPLYQQGLTFEQTILGAMLSEKFPFNYTLSADQKIAVIRNYKK